MLPSCDQWASHRCGSELSRAGVTAATRALSRKEFAERLLEVKTPSSYDLFCIAFARNRVLLFCSSALPFLLQQTRCDIDTRDENGRYTGQAWWPWDY